MAIHSLIIAPDPRLKQKSSTVNEVTDDIRQLLDDMLDTMYHAGGIGLAAVQIGVHKRLVVIDVEQDERGQRGNPIKLVNPEIVESGADLFVYKEGCLSFPEQYSDVSRPKGVRVRYIDENGDTQEVVADGLLATCIQHEIDHTNGIVFVDHISSLKRDMIHRKLQKGKKAGIYDDHSQCGHDHGHQHHAHDHSHVHGEHCNH